MPLSRSWPALAGVLVLTALPAGAGAASPPAMPQQFAVTAAGTATYKWENPNGPVGATCQDWSMQEGAVRQRFSTRSAGAVTLTPAKILGTGAGPAVITGSIDSTVASSLEPGCPAVCPDAKPAALRAGDGPLARVADCAQTSVKRAEYATACKAAALQPGVLFLFTGRSVASLQVTIQAQVAVSRDERCVKIGSGLPPVKKLFLARELRRLGAGRRLQRRRTLSGVCPGTKRTGPALTALGPLKCTYEMHLKVTVSRL